MCMTEDIQNIDYTNQYQAIILGVQPVLSPSLFIKAPFQHLLTLSLLFAALLVILIGGSGWTPFPDNGHSEDMRQNIEMTQGATESNPYLRTLEVNGGTG